MFQPVLTKFDNNFLACNRPGNNKDHHRPLNILLCLPLSEGLYVWLFCDLHTHFLLWNVCVSHKIVKLRIFLRGPDRDWHSVVCDGPNWCLADYLLGNYYQNLNNNYQLSKKDYFVTYTHILVFCDLHTHFLFCDLHTLLENGKAGATPNIWQLLSCALLTLWDLNI